VPDPKVLSLFCNPTQPQAGQQFTLTVALNGEATADVQVNIEKQRLIIGAGAVQTAPTGGNYFQTDFEPKPITIPNGGTAGISSPIKIKINALSDTGAGTPIVFPDYVIFTAYIGSVKNGFVPLMVSVQNLHPLPQT
jgi:hypothetical protein